MINLLVGLLALLYAVLIRPGLNIVIKDSPPARSAPTDTGVWFVMGTSDSGPTTPTLIQSIADFVRIFGARQTYSLLYDSLDTYFHEGGRLAYVSRVVGPTPVIATHNLADAGAGVSLVVNAIGPGAYGNSLKVGVVAGGAGGTFQIQVSDAANNILEQSNDLPDQASAIAWGRNSGYVRIVLGATALVPAVAALAALAGGTDDRVNAVDAHWQASLDACTPDLGPGQVSMPGRTTDVAHAALNAHALANNRVALLDAPDTPTVATLTTSAVNARTNGRWGGLFAPWYVVPGYVPNTTRTVPPSAVLAGLLAKNDVQFNSNVAAAGKNGESSYALDLSQPAWTSAQRQTLNDAGVNVAIRTHGAIRNFGFRSLANPVTDQSWTGLQAARTIMAYVALASVVMEDATFDEIDGFNRLFSRVQGQLIAIANQFYTAGALFGATAGEAFAVVCDSSNNTPTSINNKELHAAVELRVSEFAEAIYLEITKIAVNQTIS